MRNGLFAMVVACAAMAACETVPDKQYHPTPPAGESLSSVTMHMRLHGWGAVVAFHAEARAIECTHVGAAADVVFRHVQFVACQAIA